MKPIATIKKWGFATSLVSAFLLAGTLFTSNSCRKNNSNTTGTNVATTSTVNDQGNSTMTPLQQNKPQTFVVSVAALRKDANSTEVLFGQLEEVFRVQDATLLAFLQNALNTATPVKVTVNPWTASVTAAVAPTADEIKTLNSRTIVDGTKGAVKIDLNTAGAGTFDDVSSTSILGARGVNTTTGNLTSMIPDMATAQLMFNYITKQCCALAGPYAIDYCISFQYCEDGCYARAHKMCWIINNKFNYATQKIFSFANNSTDELCVQGQKWGGCCVNWWYHVAPLVTIKTSTGPKAFVFDPAMFDQPVLLSVWLHAQENPACVPGGKTPRVTMINVQPTSSYSPATYSGYSFDTDPSYSATNSTLVSYSTLVTCP